MIGNSTGGNNKNIPPIHSRRKEVKKILKIFLFIHGCDKVRLAGMGIIVVHPPAEVQINRRTVARAKVVCINRGVRQFYLSFD